MVTGNHDAGNLLVLRQFVQAVHYFSAKRCREAIFFFMIPGHNSYSFIYFNLKVSHAYLLFGSRAHFGILGLNDNVEPELFFNKW